MAYTKPLSETLNFVECVQLLQTLINHDILEKDPKTPNNIFVYREAGERFPEGWYTEPILTVASCLATDDLEGQKLLREELERQNISLEFEDTIRQANDIIDLLIK